MRHSGSGGGVTGVAGSTPVSDTDTHTKLDTLIAQTDGIEPSLTSIDGKLTTIINQTDGVEGSLSSIDTKVSTAANQVTGNASLSSIDGKLTSTNTKLDTLITQTDGIESLIGTTNSTLATVNTNLGTINSSLGTVNTSIISTNTKLDTIHADLIANGSYLSGNITATTTEVAARVGGANLVNRRMLTIYNQSGANIFYGPTGVTPTTGVRMSNNTDRTFEVGPNITIFVIRAAGSGTVTIQEFS